MVGCKKLIYPVAGSASPQLSKKCGAGITYLQSAVVSSNLALNEIVVFTFAKPDFTFSAFGQVYTGFAP